MKVSVIIPGYNTPDVWWERCLRSVLSQLPKESEVLCIDDGSKIKPKVDVQDDRIKWLLLPDNVGQAAARNRGLECAKGDYVWFVDSDDEVCADICPQCLSAMEKTDADITVFGVRTIWTRERLYKDNLPAHFDPGELAPAQVKDMFDRCLLEYPVNKFYSREFLRRNGIRFEDGICPGEDSVFNLACLCAHAKWCAVNKIGYVYYRSGLSSLSSYLPKYQESRERLAQAWSQYCEIMPGAKEVFSGMCQMSAPKNRGRLFNAIKRLFYVVPLRRRHILNVFKGTRRMRSLEAIMNIPSPYRVYLFERLREELLERGVSFRVNFMAKGHRERPKSWLNPKMNFDNKYWKDFGRGCHHFNPGWIIRSWFVKPDVLLVGSPFDTFTGIFAAVFARARIKCTWVEGQTKTPGKMDGAIGLFKRFVLSRFRYVAVPGKDAAQYITMHQERTKLKMPQPIVLPNLVNEKRFRPRSEWPTDEIEKCHALFGTKEGERVCLIPARLDAVKGLVPFVQALDATQVCGKWRIVIMGQGPLKADILNAAAEKGIRDSLTILDYVPYEQMPVCCAAADLFVLPSLHDPNPLSVPEALHSGLPVAISDRCGNVEEGVTDGVNGWVLPVENPISLEATLRSVFGASAEELHKRGAASLAGNARFWDSKIAIRNYVEGVGL